MGKSINCFRIYCNAAHLKKEMYLYKFCIFHLVLCTPVKTWIFSSDASHSAIVLEITVERKAYFLFPL